MPNRVRTGVEPALPKPPGMRVRTGRFTVAEQVLADSLSLRAAADFW